MSERGVFAVDRGVFDHPKLTSSNKPLSKLEAWLWLLAAAAWKQTSRRICGRTIQVGRGQVVASTRYLADEWRWSEPSVRRFLTLLKTDAGGDAEIDAHTNVGITVITIRKYGRYQRVSLPLETHSDAHSNATRDAEATHDRRKEEDTQDIQSTEANASAVADTYVDPRHQLWAEGVPLLVSLGENENRSRQMIGMWLKQTHDDSAGVLGAIQRARDNRVQGPIAWITRALKPPGCKNAKPNYADRPYSSSGRATSREADFVAALGQAALGQLEADRAARQFRRLSKSPGSACLLEVDRGPADGN